MTATISIIIPTVNRHEALAALVESLLQLPTAPHEIVIVDQTEHVLGVRPPDLNTRHDCVRHIHLDAAGPCIARNTGANIATGDILWFLDDDMELQVETDLLAYICRHFSHHPTSVLVGNFNHAGVEASQVSETMSDRFDIYRHLTRNVPVFNGEYRFSLAINAGLFAIPKHIYRMLGGFDEKFDPDGAFEDRDLALRCFYAGVPVYQSAIFLAEHKALSEGGRRQALGKMSGNMYYFWSKYLSKDMYHLQAFSFWLSRSNNWSKLLKKVVVFALKHIAHIPDYKHTS